MSTKKHDATRCLEFKSLFCVGGCEDGRCLRAGPSKREPDDSYKELMGDYGDSPVLRKAVETVDGRDKQEHYGPPEEFMGRLAQAWTAYLSPRLKDGEALTPFDGAMMMANLKILRLGSDPTHKDSLLDLGGYAYIGEKVSPQ